VAAPPYYYSVSQDDLLRYWERLASKVPVPLFLYNAPSNTHHTLKVSTVVRAANIENIAGFKDSGCDMGYFHTLRESLRARPDFALLVGPDELFAEAILLGAHGGMCGGSNVFPRLYVSLYEAAKAGDVNRVAKLHRKVIEFGSAVYRCAENPANPLRGLKCALAAMGICGDFVTSPLQPYSTAERESVRQYVSSLGGMEVI
jgi:4-hydroxy-tetrahydrodipicolinate synthase